MYDNTEPSRNGNVTEGVTTTGYELSPYDMLMNRVPCGETPQWEVPCPDTVG